MKNVLQKAQWNLITIPYCSSLLAPLSNALLGTIARSMRWTLILDARVSSTLPIIIRPRCRGGDADERVVQTRRVNYASYSARYRPNSSTKRRNDLPQIAKRRHVVDSISGIVFRWQSSALRGSATGWAPLSRKERSRATGTYSASAILPARKGGRAYFLTEPHRLSVTFRRTRPSNTPVNDVSIWLRRRATLNARVKTSAIYACLITGSIQKNGNECWVPFQSFHLNCRLMKHVRFESVNIHLHNLLAFSLRSQHNAEEAIYGRRFICGREN